MPTPTAGPDTKGVTISFDEGEMKRALADVAKWSKERTEAVRKVINSTILAVESDAKRNCPVGVYKNADGSSQDGRVGGRLWKSIRSKIVTAKSKKMTAEVGTNVEYAAFVEFGTGRRGAESGTKPPPEYIHGTINGMRARPYLVPAAEAHKARYKKRMKEALKIK